MEGEADTGAKPRSLVRLAPIGGDGRGVWCNADGVFIGPGIALVKRWADGNGGPRFAPITETHLAKVLGYGYDEAIDVAPLWSGLARVAAALEKGDLALATIALVQLRIPPFTNALNAELAAAADELVKAEWDEDAHPRFPGGAEDSKGGQFAPKDEAPAASSAGVAATTAAVGVRPMFGPLSTDALAALGRFAAGVLAASVSPFVTAGAAATAFLGVLFVPTNRSLISEGALPGLPNTTYRYNEDGRTLDLWRDGVPLYSGQAGSDGIFRDNAGNAIGRMLDGSLALDPGAVAAVAIPKKWPESDPDAATAGAAATSGAIHLTTSQIQVAAANDNDPKACPDAGADRPGKMSKNAVAYQVQISGLPILPDGMPMAVLLNGVMFDGCRMSDGHMLEAKGTGLDWAMNQPDDWRSESWKAAKSFLDQALAQAKAAPGRVIEWHFAEPRVAAFFRVLFTRPELKNVVVIYTPYVRPGTP